MKKTINLDGMTCIPDNFMKRWEGESIAFINAEEVTAIGDGFLGECQFLKSLDLAPLTNVTTIGHGFLVRCRRSLASLDLAPLTNVTTIGDYFLEGCSKLTSLDLTPLANVTTIGHGFLWWCDNLESENITWPDTEFWDKQRRLYEKNHS